MNIIKKLRPFTLFVLMFDSICGNPNVAYIDIDKKPMKGPNIGISNTYDINVKTVATAANANKNRT